MPTQSAALQVRSTAVARFVQMHLLAALHSMSLPSEAAYSATSVSRTFAPCKRYTLLLFGITWGRYFLSWTYNSGHLHDTASLFMYKCSWFAETVWSSRTRYPKRPYMGGACVVPRKLRSHRGCAYAEKKDCSHDSISKGLM